MRCYICDYDDAGDPSLFHSSLPSQPVGTVKLKDGLPICDACYSAPYADELAPGEVPTVDEGFDALG